MEQPWPWREAELQITPREPGPSSSGRDPPSTLASPAPNACPQEAQPAHHGQIPMQTHIIQRYRLSRGLVF